MTEIDKIEVDMAAVARVSSRVQLRGIKLTELNFSLNAKKLIQSMPLQPVIKQECVSIPAEKGTLEVEGRFTFNVRSGEIEVAESNFKYQIMYSLGGEEPVAEQDLIHFASANGAYHAWPFVRELVFDLTARMGFQPFTLPVLSFVGPKPKPKSEPQKTEPEAKPESE